MHAYVWTLITLMALEIVGKALMLKDGDYTKPRNAGMICFDIATAVALIVWGAYLLGSEKSGS